MSVRLLGQNKGGRCKKSTNQKKPKPVSLTISHSVLEKIESCKPADWSRSYFIDHVLRKVLNCSYNNELDNLNLNWDEFCDTSEFNTTTPLQLEKAEWKLTDKIIDFFELSEIDIAAIEAFDRALLKELRPELEDDSLDFLLTGVSNVAYQAYI